jgi:hypothetical protein
VGAVRVSSMLDARCSIAATLTTGYSSSIWYRIR